MALGPAGFRPSRPNLATRPVVAPFDMPRHGAGAGRVGSRTATLGELCEIDRRIVSPGGSLAARLPFVGVEHVSKRTGFLDFDRDSRIGSGKSATFQFDERHVLYAKLRPYLNKVATPDFPGRCSTQLEPLLPHEGVDRHFLAHVLRRKQTVDFATALSTGTRMPSIDMKSLMALPVPFPSLERQRKIADILNRATYVERMRAKAVDCHRDFAPALFVKMFGDPAENPMGWVTYPFVDLVADETRRVKKIPKKYYEEIGEIPIVDQGKTPVSGYAEDHEGCYKHPPAIVFGDHTRRFKLVRTHFFLGADGAKLLLPKREGFDPVFLFGQLMCTIIEDAGYSRHYKFLKRKSLIFPPVEKQLQYRKSIETAEAITSIIRTATSASSTLSASLMAYLLKENR